MSKNRTNKVFFRPHYFKRGVQRLFYWALGFTLLPAVWAVVRELGLMTPALMKEGYQSWWIYLAGVAAYFVLSRLLFKPVWLYVFGHELTHAISGFLSGARIYSFKASAAGGEVKLSKSNAFIALAPYVVPIYTAFIIAVYAVTRHWWLNIWGERGFQFLLGLSLAFHLSMTFSAVHGRQSDLKILGFFLSGVLIILGNTLILSALCISLFQKTPTFPQFTKSVVNETWSIWRSSFASLREEIGTRVNS